MPKTPDEIKKGLEHCITGTSCRGCPYCEECAIASDCNPMHKDLQDYIQQLESDKQQLEGMLHHMNQLRDAAAGRALKMEERVHQLEDQLGDATEMVKQLEAERDALLKYITDSSWAACDICEYGKDGASAMNCKHIREVGVPCFEWRGIQKEE